jgi:hypothetical protein
MAWTRRANVLLEQLRRLHYEVKEFRRIRNNLRDNYVQMLADAEAMLTDYQAERDDALVRLNARLVEDGEQPITLDYFKD